jgi:hypothetical protein
MSATGRSVAAETGYVRHPDDFFATPAWAVRAILALLKPGSVLDPCCGKGAILDAVRECWPGQTLWGLEIDPERAAVARKDHLVTVRDALSELSWDSTDQVITNPPYARAVEFIVRAARECPNKDRAFLLRLGFLGSRERAAFHRQHRADLFILSRRPEFCASVSCLLRKGGCGWHETLPIEAELPKTCPACGRGKLSVSRSDASEYAWFVYGAGRGNRYQILELPS